MATARTVTAVISESLTTGQGDDVSAVTCPAAIGNYNDSNSGNNNQDRRGNQLTLDNISKVITCRSKASACTTTRKSYCSSVKISSVSHMIESLARTALDSHADTCGVKNTA
jgi:hypothetical protein